MPLDPPFDATDSQSRQLNRALLRITVRPYPPPNASPDSRVASDGVDDWIVPGKASDDGFPDDWIVPGKVSGDGFPDDWIVPSPSAPLIARPRAPYTQSSPSNTGFVNPPAWPVGNASTATAPDLPFFSADRIGAMAWDPPNLPLFRPSFSTANLPASTSPSAPPIPAGSWPPTLSADSSPIPAWLSSQSLLGRIADLQNPMSAAVESGGLLAKLALLGTAPRTTPTLSLEGGLFPGAGRPASTPMPDVLHAFFQGLGSGTRQLGQTGQSFAGPPTIAAEDSPAAEPIGWSDLASPLSQVAPKVAYRFAQSYPTLAGGVVGGYVGSRLGAPAGLYGVAVGTILGGSLGAAALSAAQTLGPAYAAELQKTPNDPEGAWKRAWTQAEISGAFSGASWAVFPARFFQGPVKQLVFQTFGVQPALAVAEKTTRNVVEGKPATEGLGEAYGEGVVGTLTPAVGHKAVNWILSRPGGRTGAAPTAPAADVRTPTDAERLRGHVDKAVARLELEGLTPAQRESLDDHPYLEAAHRGERIDAFAKKTVGSDPNLKHLTITQRFQSGPDFIDPTNGAWYDITTTGRWPSHVRRYTPDFGQGSPLFHRKREKK